MPEGYRPGMATKNGGQVTLKAGGDQIAAWQASADASKMSRQAWCKVVLDAAAGLSELPEHLRRGTPAK